MKIINVSSKTNVGKLTGSILHSIDENPEGGIELRCVGASSLNQMYKAVASARGVVATRGKDLLIKAGFGTTEDGKTTLVAKLVIE